MGTSTFEVPQAWRSMLFVPAHVDRFVESAHLRGADACILDLEDSVPKAQKQAARNVLRDAVEKLVRSGGAALVRVNAVDEGQARDLDAAVVPKVAAIVLPKVAGANDVQAADRLVDDLEARRGLPRGAIRLIAQIEDVRALPGLDAIAAASPRLMAMILGSEDFSASAGIAPIAQALLLPNQMVQFACRRAGLLAFGFAASIADYADLDAFRAHVRLARQLGFVGAFCVHPSQVAVLNEEFAPSADEVAHARGLVDAFDAASAEGRGAIEFRGAMVDLPVVLRARELLSRARPHPVPTKPESTR